jgi:hypothetical protein
MSIQNKTLSKAVDDHIKANNQSLANFHLYNNTLTTVAGNPAQRVVYTYAGGKEDICRHCKSMDVLTVNNNKLYIISYFGEDVKRYTDFLDPVQYLISSIEFGPHLFRSDINATNGFLTYENDTYRIRVHYPANWTKDESNPLRDPYSNIVTFRSLKEDAFDQFQEHVRILIHNLPDANVKLDEYLSKSIDNDKKSVPGFHIIESNTDTKTNNSTIAGRIPRPSYTLVYTYDNNGTTYKTREVGTMIGDDKIFKIQYFAEASKYDKYLPIVQNMIDSLELNRPILEYENSKFGIKLQHPYNWGEAREISRPPFGYSNNDNYISGISGIRFYLPVQGIYYLVKTYRIAIDYDSPYAQQKRFLPYTITIGRDFQNKSWTKTIEEWSLDGKLNRTLDKETNFKGFFENGNGYILLNLNLDSLNLPNQFYAYFSAYVNFLNNGQDCRLTDNTDYISVPPPIYTLSTFPSSLNDMRPGDEKDIQLRVKSFTTLPFQLLLSTEEKKKNGLEITFRPNKTSGVPGELTISNLHVKVLPNATAQPYTFPIHANIFLTPVFNPGTSASASISTISNFTVSVIPPFTFQEHLANFVKDWFNPLTGIVTTISAIASGILGWRFGLKQKKKPE